MHIYFIVNALRSSGYLFRVVWADFKVNKMSFFYLLDTIMKNCRKPFSWQGTIFHKKLEMLKKTLMNFSYENPEYLNAQIGSVDQNLPSWNILLEIRNNRQNITKITEIFSVQIRFFILF